MYRLGHRLGHRLVTQWVVQNGWGKKRLGFELGHALGSKFAQIGCRLGIIPLYLHRLGIDWDPKLRLGPVMGHRLGGMGRKTVH